jgi:signal transduction histidine kinase
MNESPPIDRDRRADRWRWWGAAAGLLTGLCDAVLLAALGVSFAINGHDATLLIGAYFGLSFAVLGFLLGAVAAGRRRDQRAAAVIHSQMEALNAAQARLVQSEKLAALGQLAAAVAHEVRNPLAIMRSAAQGVAEALPDGYDDTRRACSFITAEIDRLTNVVTSLLAFARPLHIHPRTVSVHDLFDRAQLLASADLVAKQIRLQRHEPAGLPVIQADADLMCQVLLGLMANAVEAAPPGAEVTLEAQAGNGAVEIAVADSGPGVPPELRGRIFEPFFTTRPRGTGLGLAVARQIVEAHGGRIEVGERAGGGARFTVRVPVAGSAALAA